jgi:retinoid hydroxylase
MHQPTQSNPVKLPLPPGSLGLPVVGETLDFFKDGQFGQKRHKKYGSVFKTSLFGQPTIFLKGAEANQFILTHENQYFQVQWPPSLKALLGYSLSLQIGAMHQSRRRILAQAFMPRALSSYIDGLQQITDAYTKRWADQKTLIWYPELRRYTLDVACKLLVGLDDGANTPLGEHFETWSGGLFSIPLNLPWTRFGRAKRCRERLLKEIESIILARQAQMQQAQAEHGDRPHAQEDALSLLLRAEDEDGARLTVDELKDQILLLLFAGHETLTSGLATFCLQVAQHPEILERLRAEQQRQPQAITLETLKEMTYLEQVLKEVLRLTPPVGGVFRKVLQDCTYEGYQLPQNWSVLCQIGSTHSSADHYPDPDVFDPERFSPERQEKQAKYSYIPFGGGVRECLGKEFARLEMKVFASHLLRHYQWDLLPNQDLTLLTIPTPIPRDGLKVSFEVWPDTRPNIPPKTSALES